MSPISTVAATTPSLGVAATFGVLSSTYTNIAAGIINGDLGYTTPPAVFPTINGVTYVADAVYNQAGIDQGVALAALNAEGCDHSFPAGAIDLATDITHGPIGVYTPGVYCVTGAQSVGVGGITLNGAGTYIFRSTGALNTNANSVITLAGGASDCDVFWTPVATTLGANSTFVGTVIDDSGITVGSTVTWAGRALSFGGTVTTNTDTISIPSCSPAKATLHVAKRVINDDDGVATVSLFDLFVKLSGTNVIGSPATGTAAPGTSYSLPAGTYVVSETANASYVGSFSGDCNAGGSITLASGDDKTCTLTNDDIGVSSSGGGSHSHATAQTSSVVKPVIKVIKIPSPLTLRTGEEVVIYTEIVTNPGTVPLKNILISDDKCEPVKYVSGDKNGDLKLDIDERWVYFCHTKLTKTTTNTVNVSGEANGLIARDSAIATVNLVPMLPNTGFPEISVFTRSLSLGSRGTDVSALQTALEQKGFLTIPNGVAKGYFGALTRMAVIKYQESVNLPMVGVFGPLTKVKLISELGE